MTQAEYFPGIFAKFRELFLFALFAGPGEEFVAYLLPTFRFIIFTTETPADGVKVSYEGSSSASMSGGWATTEKS